MSMYFTGYRQAREAVASMSKDELLDHIDALYGRGNLEENFTLEDLRCEAYRQTRLDFTDTSSPEFEMVCFYTKLISTRR